MIYGLWEPKKDKRVKGTELVWENNSPKLPNLKNDIDLQIKNKKIKRKEAQ